MKLKSFKKKGATGDALSDMALMQSLPDHYNVPIGQIKIDSKQQYFEIMWKNYNDGGEKLDTGDVLALAIGDSQKMVMASISKVSMVGDHQRASLQSSKPSSRWTRFLKELKKKCDSGHHNKKRKTLLHVVRVAQDKPESIQLRLRQNLAQENDAKPGEAELRAVVGKIQQLIEEADTAGQSLDLDELDELLPSDVVIDDVNHVPKRAKFEAMTIVMNGVSVTTSKTSSNKRSITISKKDLKKALYYNTEQTSPVELDKDELNLEGLLDIKQHRVRVSVYSHNHNLTVHSNKSVQDITKSPNGNFVFELEPSIAGSGTLDLESALIQITSYKLEDGGAVDGSAIADDPFDYYNQILEIPEVSLQDSNIIRARLQMSDARLFPFEGDTYFVSVGDTHAAVTVDSVVVGDMIAEPVKQILVDFSYMGGDDLALFEAERRVDAEQRPLIMRRLNNASPPRDSAIQWTLEYLPGADLAGDNPPRAQLVAIVDEIAVLIREDQDGISVAELADWLGENHQLDPALMVTGAEYKPKVEGYNTESSVTGGLKIDVWMSADGEYSLFDLDPADQFQLANVESVVHSSTLGDGLPESEVKRGSFAQLLEEVRQQKLEGALDEVGRADLMAEVDPLRYDPSQYPLSSQYRVSVHSAGEGGYGVCNNEKIWRVLRKKKDGKCIYRIVVKNSVRANRIHHGKHRKCIMYIDRYAPVVEPVE
jgi:hypothetical protein